MEGEEEEGGGAKSVQDQSVQEGRVRWGWGTTQRVARRAGVVAGRGNAERMRSAAPPHFW